MLKLQKKRIRGRVLKSLIIVESPTKAKTIKGFLDSSYEVIASKGHIRDLPKSSFGIKIEDGTFTPQYRVAKENAPTVKEIKELAKKSEKIYIATDEDREGEAIGYHIAIAIKKEPLSLPRITFHEITKSAILKSLQNPAKIDLNRVNAQQTRRLLDRIVGYKLSPLLSSKIQRGLSAGRVQSSALKIVVQREREISEFKPIEYHKIDGIYKSVEFNLIEYKDEKLEKLSIKDETMAKEIVKSLLNSEFKVESIDVKSRKSPSPAPFMTSTLQQSASTNLGFSAKKTMMLAQSLYEGIKTKKETTGLITYMRTDSLNISKEAIEGVREFIGSNFPKEYLPNKAKLYRTKSKSSQEAHEAIRPTNLELSPDKIKSYLKDDEYKLYRLIYNRFIASQMEDAIFESKTIILSSEVGKFKTNGRELKFDGFYKIYGDIDKDRLLPEFKVDSKVEFEEIKSTKHFTEPPSRYSEASLIKKLESLGIGRPSTYAPTISTLLARGYIEIEKKAIQSTEIADKVIDVLDKYFNEIVDSSFTAKLEEELDEIAESKKEWQGVLREFYEPFIEKIEVGKKEIKSQKIAIPIGEKCPECNEELVKRKGRFGEFIACSSYPECKYTRAIEDDESEEIDEVCEKCNSKMIIKYGKNGKFLACSNYPECKNTKSLKNSQKEPAVKVDVPCPECRGEIIERSSRRGKFFGCSNYPKCKFISKFKPVDRKCSECGYLMAERTYRKKDIYECIKCKHREDRES